MATRRATHPASLKLSGSARRVGLVALAALIVFGSGLAVGLRSGNGGQQGGEAATPSVTARYPDPGPIRVIDGVGVGYARSEAGALAAASEFLSVGGGSLASDEDAYLAAMAEMAAPEWRASARETGRNAVAFVAERYGEDATSVTVPVAHEVVDHNPDTATIEIYSVMVASGSKLPGGEQLWGLSRVQLRWVDGDWKLSSEDNVAAPAPALLPGQRPGDIGSILDGFEPYG
jgi:hypothetical protein